MNELREKVAVAIWDELCPGIRRLDADVQHYEKAADAVLTVLKPLLEEREGLREAFDVGHAAGFREG